MSSPRRYCVSIAPTHWTPFDERISAHTEADTLAAAEWIYDAYVRAAPTDGVNYEIELSEWDYQAGEAVNLKRTYVERVA
jgi:hypothetical protein